MHSGGVARSSSFCITNVLAFGSNQRVSQMTTYCNRTDQYEQPSPGSMSGVKSHWSIGQRSRQMSGGFSSPPLTTDSSLTNVSGKPKASDQWCPVGTSGGQYMNILWTGLGLNPTGLLVRDQDEWLGDFLSPHWPRIQAGPMWTSCDQWRAGEMPAVRMPTTHWSEPPLAGEFLLTTDHWPVGAHWWSWAERGISPPVDH